MTTATIEKTTTVRFEAAGDGGLRVVIEPQSGTYNTAGSLVPTPGSGRTIEFQRDGHGGQYFETDDPAIIEYMRARIADPVRPAAYFERPPIIPPSAPVIAEIAKLAAARDVDGLAQLYRDESENWQREDVLAAIQSVADAMPSEG